MKTSFVKPALPGWRSAGFSIAEMAVCILILSLFILIFMQMEFLLIKSKESERSLSGLEDRTFSALIAIYRDIHNSTTIEPDGSRGIRLHHKSGTISWVSHGRKVVKRLNGRVIWRADTGPLSFQIVGDRRVIVESEDGHYSITAVMGGVP